MLTMVLKVRTIAEALIHARPKMLLQIAKQRFWSKSRAFGLVRNLDVEFTAPSATIPLSIRPIRRSDVQQLLDINAPGLDSEGVQLRLSRKQLLNTKIPTCYVAETSDGNPCYMQWLITSEHNTAVKKYFKGYFPWLNPGEALLEGAFTPENYRGYRIMPCAMAHIAAEARHSGARRVITFVAEDNIPSLKGCKRAGFHIYLSREERWRLFRRKIKFVELPETTLFPFDQESEKPFKKEPVVRKAELTSSGRRLS